MNERSQEWFLGLSLSDEANTNSRKEKESVFIVKGGDLAEKYKVDQACSSCPNYRTSIMKTIKQVHK